MQKKIDYFVKEAVIMEYELAEYNVEVQGKSRLEWLWEKFCELIFKAQAEMIDKESLVYLHASAIMSWFLELEPAFAKSFA